MRIATDREKLTMLIDEMPPHEGKTFEEALADHLIANSVTVQKHGRWIECDWVEYDGHSECVRHPKMAWKCSNCCNAFKKELLWKRNYCPNCGADMRGEGDGQNN